MFVCGSIILTDSTQQNSSSRKLSRRIWSLCSAHIRLNLNRFGFLFFLFFKAVSFNGTAAAKFTVVSDTYMTALVPTGATTGLVIVTTPKATLQSNKKFGVPK